jgi:hypothetical protein
LSYKFSGKNVCKLAPGGEGEQWYNCTIKAWFTEFGDSTLLEAVLQFSKKAGFINPAGLQGLN